MEASRLPPELIALVHHVELNRTGWWDSALDRMILATLWVVSAPLSIQEISKGLRDRFAVRLDVKHIESRIGTLTKTGALVSLGEGRFKVSEPHLRAMEEDLKRSEAIEMAVEQRFLRLIGSLCPSLPGEDTWRAFRDGCLLPLIREGGAKTYELLTADALTIDRATTMQAFLEAYPAETRIPLQQVAVAFLDAKDGDVRSYILGHLNAAFLLEASSLSDDTLKRVDRLSGARASFSVFVDTNVLFSMLDLHDNPFNEAAVALLGLIRELPSSVSFKLYVAPPTLDEMRHVLEERRQSLSGMVLTPNVAEAVGRGQLGGVAMRYVQRCREAKRPLNANDYFEPYISGLLEIIRAKGLELYNENVTKYKESQVVIDDVMEQLEREKRFDKPKTYEEIMHDATLWHLVRAKRPATIESPVDAKFWITTIDFRFLGFDSFKRRNNRHEVPLCVHPTPLVQMLQFWIPRTPQLEEALVASIRYRFLFFDFDARAEAATIRILATLSRFEGVGDLPRDTIARLLMNQVLRQKLTAEGGIEKQIEAVRDALVDEGRRVSAELAATRQKADELKERVEGGQEEIERLRARERERVVALSKVTAELSREQRLRSEVVERLARIEEESEKRTVEIARADAWQRFLLRASTLGLMGLALWLTVVWLLAGRVGRLAFWGDAILVWVAVMLVWVWLVDRLGVRDVVVKEDPRFNRWHRRRNRIFAWLGAILGAAVVRLVANPVADAGIEFAKSFLR